jgi:hypothetical protein
MPKTVVTGQATDGAKWERGFRTHAKLFKSMTVNKPIRFSVTGNEFVICFEASDLDKYMEILESSATEEAIREFDPR